MAGRNTLMRFCAGLICLTATSHRVLGEQQYGPESAPKSALSAEPSRLPDSSLQRTQDQSGAFDSLDPERSIDPERPVSEGSRLTLNTETPGIARSKKASCLIGMEVRNRQNEKLGDIKDVVMDLPSGRVNYAILCTGGFLGVGERLTAIPPITFQMSLDGDHLVINADKQKIKNAPSFARVNWPDPQMADIEAYWASDREAVGGTSAGVSVGSASGRSDSGERPQERTSHRNEPRRSDNHVFKGKITAITPENRTMTVTSKDDSRDFTLADRAILVLKTSRNPHLIDFKVGYPVAVGYHAGGNGNCIADSVSRTDAP